MENKVNEQKDIEYYIVSTNRVAFILTLFGATKLRTTNL